MPYTAGSAGPTPRSSTLAERGAPTGVGLWLWPAALGAPPPASGGLWEPPPVMTDTPTRAAAGAGGGAWPASRLAAAMLSARGAVIQVGATQALADNGLSAAARAAPAHVLTAAMLEVVHARQTGSAYALASRSYEAFARLKGLAALPVTPSKLYAYLFYRASAHVAGGGARAGELVKSSGLDDTFRHLRTFFKDAAPGDWGVDDDSFALLQRAIGHVQHCLPATLESSEPVSLENLSAVIHLAAQGGAPSFEMRRFAAYLVVSLALAFRGEDADEGRARGLTITARGVGFQPAKPKTSGGLVGAGERRVAPHVPLALGQFCAVAALRDLHGPAIGTPSYSQPGRALFPLEEQGPGSEQPWPAAAGTAMLRQALAALGLEQQRLDVHWARASTAALWFNGLRFDSCLRNAMGGWSNGRGTTVERHYMTMSTEQLVATAHTAALEAGASGPQCCDSAPSSTYYF